jgi:prevent-host-death family protein
MQYTATRLRENIFQVLDQVIETGVPVEIKRRGKVLRIVPAEPRKKLDNLQARPYLTCDPEDIVHVDWSAEWRP